MNLLSTILDRLNQRIEVGNIFDQIYGLSEPVGEGNDKAWAFYIGNGQAIPVTNFDAKQGTLFWAKRGKITVAKNDSLRLAGCKSIYETRFSMTAYAMVRKSHLPCDSADAQDWVASRVLKLISGTDPQFKTAIGVIAYEVVPSGYQNEIRYLPVNYEWAAVAIDVDVNVSTSSEDGCYDTCATGDIPLPDFEPCTPCLTEVAVDGVTITGNGTPADPLVAIGGGGGTPLRTQEEGTNVSTNTTTLNFTGAGVTASLTSPGVVEVNVPGGGGGGEDLQQTTDIGNTTTNNIAFTGTAGLSFDNGAFIRKGTTDAGNGGAKGTAQICSISYELKWEAGRLYYMEQDGFTIRDVTHNFTLVPQVTDDSSKGFVVGSRWSLDDGTVYLCSDASVGAAVWTLQTASVPNLQDVTDVGNTTTNDLIVQGANDFVGQVSSQSISAFNTITNAYAEMFVGTSGQLSLSDGTSAGILTINNLTSTNVQLEFPNKTTGTYTIATTADLTGGTVTDVTATAPLSSSGGTTPDISISQADTTTDGYLSSADWNTFDGKFDVPTGTNADYLDGTGTPTLFPTLTNGTVTSVATAGLISGGPITTSGTITTAMTTNKLVGRATAGSGIMEEITVGSGLTLTGAGVLNNTATPTPTGYYGAFQDTTSQTAASINTAYAVKFNTTDLSNGVTVVNDGSSNPTRVTLANTGIYNIQFSLQMEKTGGSGNMIADIWIRKNGVDIPSTTGKIVLTGSANASPVVAAWNYVLDLVAGDYVQIMWSTSNTNVEIVAAGPTAPHPAIPSSILTVTQQAGILAGTGITAINSLTGAVQTIGTGTTGTDFAVVSSGTSHTFNLPTASGTNRGALSSGDWTTFNGKFNTPSGTTSQYIRGDGTLATFPTLPLVYKSAADTAGYQSTANTAVYTQLIAANTFAAGDIIRVSYRAKKLLTNGATTTRIYINSTANLSGSPIQVGILSGLAASRFLQMERHLVIKNTTNATEVAIASSTLNSDTVNTGNFDTLVINWTNALYFVFAFQNASALDTNFGSMYLIEKL